MAKVKLTVGHQGVFAWIDAEDLALVADFRWSIAKISGRTYAKASKQGDDYGPYLHRVIARAKKGDIVRFIDDDPLNCTRENLEIVRAGARQSIAKIKQEEPVAKRPRGRPPKDKWAVPPPPPPESSSSSETPPVSWKSSMSDRIPRSRFQSSKRGSSSGDTRPSAARQGTGQPSDACGVQYGVPPDPLSPSGLLATKLLKDPLNGGRARMGEADPRQDVVPVTPGNSGPLPSGGKPTARRPAPPRRRTNRTRPSASASRRSDLEISPIGGPRGLAHAVVDPMGEWGGNPF